MPHLTPESFGRAAGGWNDDFFRFRVGTTDSKEHLRAVIDHEIDRRGETRRWRIGYVNEQLQDAK